MSGLSDEIGLLTAAAENVLHSQYDHDVVLVSHTERNILEGQ